MGRWGIRSIAILRIRSIEEPRGRAVQHPDYRTALRSSVEVIRAAGPGWHRQGACAGHQERKGNRAAKVPEDKIAAVRAALTAGNGIRKVAKLLGVGNETVHRIAREMRQAA